MSEQRQQQRFDDPPIDVDGVWTAVHNISLGGMCIGTVDPLKIGWRRRFKLVDRQTRKDWTILGEIVWVTPVTNEMTRVGVRWLEVDPETQAWLEQQIRSPRAYGSK